MEQDSLGFWNAILAENDSSYVVDQLITQKCTADDTGEVVEDYIYAFVEYSDGLDELTEREVHSAVIGFDGITEELTWDTRSDSEQDLYKTSIDSTKWTGWVADNYPNESIESVYKYYSYGSEWTWVFFASDCFIAIDDYYGDLVFDACSVEGARTGGATKYDLKTLHGRVELPKRSAPIKGMDIGSLIKKGVVKKGLAHKAILDKNFGVKLKADKSKKPAPPKKKKARLPFKNR